jgi:hypothetical protein
MELRSLSPVFGGLSRERRTMTRRAWLLAFPAVGILAAVVSALKPSPRPASPPVPSERAIILMRTVVGSREFVVRNLSSATGVCVSDLAILIRRGTSEAPSVASPLGWKPNAPGFEDSTDSWVLSWSAASHESRLCPGTEAGPFGVASTDAPVLASQLQFTTGEQLDIPASAFLTGP